MNDRTHQAPAKLPIPIARLLREDVDELALERTWRRIATRDVRPARPRRSGAHIAAIMALFASSSVLAGVWVQNSGPAELVAVIRQLTGRADSVRSTRAPIVKVAPAPVPASIAVEQPAPPAIDDDAEDTRALADPTPTVVRTKRFRVSPPTAPAEKIPEVEVREQAPSAPAEVGAPTESWRTFAARGDHAGALRLLGTDGLRSASENGGSPEDLFLLADLARLANEPRQALLPLERIVAAHPEDPSAGLAAFTAGKIRMQLGDASGAAMDFDAALRLGVPSALEPEARRRRSEAQIASSLEDLR